MLDSEDDKRKFEKIYEKYKNIMYFVAYGYLKDVQQAEDAVHEAFIKIIGRFNKFYESSCPQTKAYCVIICRNISLNMLERDDRYSNKQISMEELPYDIADGKQFEEDIVNNDMLDLVTERILQLPDIYRDVFQLYYNNEYSLKEIAQILDISVDTAKKRLQRARSQLTAMLKEGEVMS